MNLLQKLLSNYIFMAAIGLLVFSCSHSSTSQDESLTASSVPTLANMPPPQDTSDVPVSTVSVDSGNPEELGAEGTPIDVDTADTNEQFQWAVQAYESGSYEEAIAKLEKVAALGPSVSSFELVPFYQGMSYYNLKKYDPAIHYLEAYLQSNPDVFYAQEARITLLLSYQAQKKWAALTALAAETEKQEGIYMENRILIKLIWAQALIEQKELGGARKALEEAQSLLNNIPKATASPAQQLENIGVGDDLQGRYFWTQSLLDLRECELKRPLHKSQEKNKKSVNAYLMHWIELRTDCLEKNIQKVAEILPILNMQWNDSLSSTLRESLDKFFNLPQQAIAEDALPYSMPEILRITKSKLRSSLYRFSQSMENFIHNAHINSERMDATYQKIRNHIEHLIQKLSLKKVPT